MALKIGNNAVTGAYLGANQVRRAYKGSSLVFQGFSPASEQEFIQQTAAGGPAQLLKVYGKSIVNNQLIKDYTDSSNLIARGGSSISYTDGKLQISLASTSSSDAVGVKMKGVTPGRKYLIITATSGTLPANYKLGGASDVGDLGITYQNFGQKILNIGASLQTPNINGAIWFWGTATSFTIDYLEIIDLTLRFDAGNEPTSVDEALRLLGGDAFDPTYDPGSLQSNKTAELRAERVPIINLWDEEWEVGAYYSSTGEKYDGNQNRIRSKHPCKCLPTTSYYLLGDIVILFYDENLNFTRAYYTASQSRIITTNSNECYFNLFTQTNVDNPTYNHDICINLSDPAINGHYFSHWRGSLALDLATLTSGGTPCCPDGLAEWAGTADELLPEGILKRRLFKPTLSTNVGDMSNYSWEELRGVAFSSGSTNMPVYETRPPYFSLNFGSSADSSSSIRPNSTSFLWLGVSSRAIIHLMSVAYATSIGVYDSNNDKIDLNAYAAWIATVDRTVYYIMSTEQRILLDTPLPSALQCQQNDILKRVSDNNCPFVGEMRFGL